MGNLPISETVTQIETKPASLVLYCLLRKKIEGEKYIRFCMMRKQGCMTFPATKFRPREDLYSAMIRPLEEDFGLPFGSFLPEKELQMIPNEGIEVRYEGLPKHWFLYPVDFSLTEKAWAALERVKSDISWWTMSEIQANAQEPNVLAMAEHISALPELLKEALARPSMEALAGLWASKNEGGVRIVRSDDIQRILDSGSRAFNLRVADPYLPYQKQGLGFTWSFFTPKDKQDVHVHGLPAVEIYGIIEGHFQIWHKPMNQRGVRMWQNEILAPGDWMEIEALHCHFGCWLEPKGLGTVLKASAIGELAGVGPIGVAGKTTCKYCNVHEQCAIHPRMKELIQEYSKPFNDRDYDRIKMLAEGAVIGQEV